jgi:hypothetical protein
MDPSVPSNNKADVKRLVGFMGITEAERSVISGQRALLASPSARDPDHRDTVMERKTVRARHHLRRGSTASGHIHFPLCWSTDVAAFGQGAQFPV